TRPAWLFSLAFFYYCRDPTARSKVSRIQTLRRGVLACIPSRRTLRFWFWFRAALPRLLHRYLLRRNQNNWRLKLPPHSSIISTSIRLTAALTLVWTSTDTHARSGLPRIRYLPTRQTGGWAPSS